LYSSGTPPVKALLSSLRKTICRFNDTYILLDALDESPRGNKREGVLDAVQTIRQWGLPTLHLLVTSRNEMDIRLTLEPPSSQDIVPGYLNEKFGHGYRYPKLHFLPA
jgi:hypothetical protein